MEGSCRSSFSNFFGGAEQLPMTSWLISSPTRLRKTPSSALRCFAEAAAADAVRSTQDHDSRWSVMIPHTKRLEFPDLLGSMMLSEFFEQYWLKLPTVLRPRDLPPMFRVSDSDIMAWYVAEG